MKKIVKFLVPFVVLGLLFVPTSVSANEMCAGVTNGEICVFPFGTRPLIGNIRGWTSVTHPWALSHTITSNGVRARTDVENHNSNGTYLNTTRGVQMEETLSGNLVFEAFVNHGSSNTTGSSRRGRVVGIGQNRPRSNTPWNREVRGYSQTW